MRSTWLRIGVFFASTVIITRTLVLLAKRLDAPTGSALYWTVRHAFMLVPGVVAVCLLLLWREPIRSSLGLRWTPNRWWIVAWSFPAALALAQIAVTLWLVPGTVYRPPATGPLALVPLPPLLAGAVLALLVGPTILILGAIGEEVAWRGFLHRELEKVGFWKEALIVGLLWAVWHLPAVLDLQRLQNEFSFTLLLLSPVILWLRLRGDSVWCAVLLHGTLNTAGHLPSMFVHGGSRTAKALVGHALLAGCLTALAWARRSRHSL